MCRPCKKGTDIIIQSDIPVQEAFPILREKLPGTTKNTNKYLRSPKISGKLFESKAVLSSRLGARAVLFENLSEVIA